MDEKYYQTIAESGVLDWLLVLAIMAGIWVSITIVMIWLLDGGLPWDK